MLSLSSIVPREYYLNSYQTGTNYSHWTMAFWQHPPLRQWHEKCMNCHISSLTVLKIMYYASNIYNASWPHKSNLTKVQLTHRDQSKLGNILHTSLWSANHCVLINISLKFVSNRPIDNKWPLVQVTAWWQTNLFISKPWNIWFQYKFWILKFVMEYCNLYFVRSWGTTINPCLPLAFPAISSLLLACCSSMLAVI